MISFCVNLLSLNKNIIIVYSVFYWFNVCTVGRISGNLKKIGDGSIKTLYGCDANLMFCLYR